MLELFNKLQKILLDQINSYKELCKALKEEKDMVTTSAIDSLHLNNKRKETLILQIRNLEEDCKRVLAEINKNAPPEKRPVTLSGIAATIKHPKLSKLKNTYSELITLAGRVKDQNEYNKRYINGSLRVIRSSISFLASCAKAGTPVYEKGGQMKSEALTSAMICEEA